MNVSDAVKNRFSVRKYKNRPVEEEILLKIIEAARFAPSAVNFQPWHFIIVSSPEGRKKIERIYPREWIKTAPLFIIACSDHSQSWRRGSDQKDSADIDIAIAVDHMTLQATELGLGTCWICNFDVVSCSKLFNIPAHIEPVVILPVGYSDISSPVKKRKEPEQIIHRELF